jgi:hypothetical protein
MQGISVSAHLSLAINPAIFDECGCVVSKTNQRGDTSWNSSSMHLPMH